MLVETWLNASDTREEVASSSTPFRGSETDHTWASAHPGVKELLSDGCFLSRGESLPILGCHETLLLIASLSAMLWAGKDTEEERTLPLFLGMSLPLWFQYLSIQAELL